MNMNPYRTIFLLLFVSTSCAISAQTGLQDRQSRVDIRSSKIRLEPKPSYQEIRIAAVREIRHALNKADTKNADSLVGAAVTKVLVQNIFPAWYGTPWDFNGHTNTPDTSTVACGYFVSTTLKHIGFNLNRYKLAQQASMIVTKSLDPHGIETLWEKPVTELVTYFKSKPPGLWTVGLSYHVGFLHWDGFDLYFIHSNYLDPVAVVKEKALESEALGQSTVFCLGNITHNPWLMKKWQNGSVIPILHSD
jgi:hypothetical protein